MKLTAKESAAFVKIGAAICTAKEQGKIKKSELVHVQSVLDANKDAFKDGVTIGKYKFTTTERVELAAIEI